MFPIGNELILCSQTYNDSVDFRKLGNTIINSCSIDMRLFEKKNYTTYFYQMYLKTDENNYELIPVRITNTNNNPHFVKRFFLVYQYKHNNVNQNNQIRFYLAKDIKFEVELKTENDLFGRSYIKRPILTIKYDNLYYTEGSTEIKEVTFKSNYYMNLSNIMKWTKILFSICFVFVFIVVVARMYVWTILNPARLTKGTYSCYFLMTLIFKTCKYFGIIFFFFTWALTGFWYLFFKCQYRPYVFFPSLFESYWAHYRKFDILWGLACGSYGLYMLFRIYEQINCDVFFIDWEHEKDILETVMGKRQINLINLPGDQYMLLINLIYCKNRELSQYLFVSLC